MEVCRKDGSVFPAHLSIAEWWAGGHRHFTGILRDLSALHREQAERTKLEAQLYQAQKMEAIGNLTGGMAHDFNNMLGVVIGNLDLLRDLKGGDSDVDELTREALEAAFRGADLTRRLLAFARQQPLRPQRVDVNELVSGIARLLRRTLGEDIEISLNLAAELGSVVVDPAQLEASLTNLATNARDAMPEGGRLVIVTGNRTLDSDYAAQHTEVVPGDYVMLEVCDTGCGMTPEVIHRIFEPFFTTKARDKGTGLGLSMVFGFIKQSGGHIGVYSEPGIGTTFRLFLPRTTHKAPAVADSNVIPLAHGNGETVLVVE
ncbi:MAG: hybrid sensor histidine kinase/response regulator, partial [Alphaproteobacteria bacterium]|nr:hybrid sensor histidine kinase/response regulator [Alphaproteobacteria bacterium]